MDLGDYAAHITVKMRSSRARMVRVLSVPMSIPIYFTDSDIPGLVLL